MPIPKTNADSMWVCSLPTQPQTELKQGRNGLRFIFSQIDRNRDSLAVDFFFLGKQQFIFGISFGSPCVIGVVTEQDVIIPRTVQNTDPLPDNKTRCSVDVGSINGKLGFLLHLKVPPSVSFCCRNSTSFLFWIWMYSVV